MRGTARKMRPIVQALGTPPGGLAESPSLGGSFGDERRNRPRPALLVDGNEGEEGMGGDGTLAGPRVFGQDFHLDLHRGMGRVADLGANDDEFLDARWTQEVQPVHGSCHHGATGMASRRDGRGHVDPLHHDTPKQRPHAIGVGRQHGLGRLDARGSHRMPLSDLPFHQWIAVSWAFARVKPERPGPRTMKQAKLYPILIVALCLPTTAVARSYKLDEILDLARKGNPGLAAGEQATAGIEAQLLEAKRSWMPSGEINSLLAQAPSIHCQNGSDGPANEKNCVQTEAVGANTSGFLHAITPAGVFTRTELKLVQPIYTFGKISAGVAAAESGVKASQNRQFGLVADLDLNVRKAYWGAKLATEILATLNEASGYLDQAQKKIEEELSEGSGDASVTDRLRLRTMRAEIDGRILEAQRMADLARVGLRALIGADAPADLEVDADPLDTLKIPDRPLKRYEDEARESRPEVKALDHMVAAKRALAQLESRRQYPDIVLIGTAAYAYASSVDTPQNAYFNDPFHTLGAGIAAGFRMPLDLGVKGARAAKLHAEAKEAEQKQREALNGIAFEVEKAHTELLEAGKRTKVMQKGEKAGRQWIAAVAQNIAVGVSEAKDFSDALLAFFQARVRYLQSMYDYNIAAAALTRATGVDVTADNP
jgi:outer membrane protein